MDESAKNNIVNNLEKKIGKFTTKEEDRIYLKESMWEQLKKDGYKKNEERKNKERKNKERKKKNRGKRIKMKNGKREENSME